MRSLPRTPSKADDGIESLKLSLNTKWDIRLPMRDSTWSPSRRDPYCDEERICTSIQLLYFRDAAALQAAIADFEENAINIYSHWQYKAKAEIDVVPHRDPSKHEWEGSFLRKRNNIPTSVVKDLTESLLHHLLPVVDRVNHAKNPLQSPAPGGEPLLISIALAGPIG